MEAEGGMKAKVVKRLKELELENSRQKRLLADTILDKEILKDMIRKKLVPDEQRELVTLILLHFGISLRRALDLIGLS